MYRVDEPGQPALVFGRTTAEARRVASDGAARQEVAAAAAGGGCCNAEDGQDEGPSSPAAAGSRRRRLWELDSHAHCPVVGVCLPAALARRLVDKLLRGRTLGDDYEVHCGLVCDCKQRTRTAEAVHKALDQRHAGVIRLAGGCKTAEALAAWWRQRSPGAGLPGALWAVLTHPLCTPALEHQVLGEVHMRQHQLGHETRADHARLAALEEESVALGAERAALKARLAQQAAEHAAERQQLQADALQLRGQLLSRETLVAQLQGELEALRRAAPDLPARRTLAEQLQAQGERMAALQRELAALRQALAAPEARAHAAAPQAAPASPRDGWPAEAARRPSDADDAGGPDDRGDAESAEAAALRERQVLCVGGRIGAVPMYRELLEGLGARFEHHDGGQEQGTQRLQACLAAADLVICQAGCVSHDAYWRVKEHCKRTGKRCVFVETPSASSLRRALRAALAGPLELK